MVIFSGLPSGNEKGRWTETAPSTPAKGTEEQPSQRPFRGVAQVGCFFSSRAFAQVGSFEGSRYLTLTRRSIVFNGRQGRSYLIKYVSIASNG